MIAGEGYGARIVQGPMHKGQSSGESQRLRDQAQEKGAAYMASHPLATLVVAIAVGVTLGWLIKRR
jgi:ElaB/YqjD/DUF883 family membrane-anchored ribosome-binding protein